MASSNAAVAAGTASPTKRRAALAPLDANAMPSSPKAFSTKDGLVSAPVPPSLKAKSPLASSSPAVSWSASAALAVGKRPAGEDAAGSAGRPPAKKPCLEERDDDANQQHRPSRSQSPDSVSIFDTSAGEGDSSWATAATDLDYNAVAAALARPLPRPSLTREQAREKAEILRLRLGLASYKVRTGQEAVPLAELRRLPLSPAGRRTVRVQSPAPSHTTAAAAADENHAKNKERDEGEGEDEDNDDDDSQSQILPQSQQSASTHVSASTTCDFDASVTIAATPPPPNEHDMKQQLQQQGEGEQKTHTEGRKEVQEQDTKGELTCGAATGLLSLAMASMS
ncbi:hypothetical protein PLICBS_003159 [Purpureocillium lilacinum]|uniref:uncharacterized protein n=1 Tax=Purpureocillium lilacinum TaxID=33203 RepID=UPI002081FE7A|nr:hypothetical protein PLICBS_003159 [Purpureocillium lilacinum]